MVIKSYFGISLYTTHTTANERINNPPTTKDYILNIEKWSTKAHIVKKICCLLCVLSQMLLSNESNNAESNYPSSKA